MVQKNQMQVLHSSHEANVTYHIEHDAQHNFHDEQKKPKILFIIWFTIINVRFLFHPLCYYFIVHISIVMPKDS